MRRAKHREGSPTPRGAAAISAAAFVLAAASCGFVGADMFPKELQYAEAGYDLAADLGTRPDKAPELGIESLRSLDGASGVFALTNRKNGWHLTILDGRMGLIRELKDDYFSRFLGSNSGADSFICGSTSIRGDFAINASGALPGTEDRSLDIEMTDYVLNFRESGGSFFDLARKSTGDVGLSDTPIVSGSYFDPLDSSVLFAGSGAPRLFVLVRNRSGGGNEALCLGFPDHYASLGTILDGAPLASNALISKTAVSADYVDDGWVTDDGIVLLLHGGDSRFARFAFGTGEEIDSLRADTEWVQAPCFDSSGEYWYYYDRGSGFVKKLRTWWR